MRTTQFIIIFLIVCFGLTQMLQHVCEWTLFLHFFPVSQTYGFVSLNGINIMLMAFALRDINLTVPRVWLLTLDAPCVVGLMTAPRIVINARPATTIVVSAATTTQSRPVHAVSGAPGATARSVSVGAVHMSSQLTTADHTDLLTDHPTSEPDVGTDASRVEEVFEGNQDTETTEQMDEDTPNLSTTQTLAGQDDFLDALASLDASTGNLPFDDMCEDGLRWEFNKEDSPDVVEI